MHKPTPADEQAARLIRFLRLACLLAPLLSACAATAPANVQTAHRRLALAYYEPQVTWKPASQAKPEIH